MFYMTLFYFISSVLITVKVVFIVKICESHNPEIEKIIKYLKDIELCNQVKQIIEGDLEPIKLFPGN